MLATIPADDNAATVERIYQMFITENGGGLIRNLNLDPKGLLATAHIRETWGGWDKPLNLNWVAGSTTSRI